MAIQTVLTGDLVNSQKVADPVAYIKCLGSTLDELNRTFEIKSEIFRGDGFQIVPDKPEQAFLCAILVRAGLIASSPKGERWDARVAVGASAAQSNGTQGEAFVLSGQGLDKMRSSMGIYSSSKNLLRHLELTTEFVAAIIDEWTIVEAQTYYTHRLNKHDQESVAQVLGKTQSTVNRALKRAHARLLDLYLIRAAAWIRELEHA